jgi:hypothetical protein
MSSEAASPLPYAIAGAAAAGSTPPARSANDVIDDSGWSDISEGSDGEPSGVGGIPWSELTSKHLRKLCSRLSVKGVKNLKKQDMVAKISIVYCLCKPADIFEPHK